MMQLTRAADYAVRVMIHLASQPEGAVVSKTLLAKAAEAPESFLSKILQALARRGLIRAWRGVEGGFSLLPPGAQASLLDVVESIDGPIALNLCLTSDDFCQRRSDCAVYEVWRQAQSAMLSVLREAKIAQMVPAPDPRRTPLKIAGAPGRGKRVANQQSSPGPLPPKSGTKVRPHKAPAGSTRITRKKKI
jgi:Rrf2 family protein